MASAEGRTARCAAPAAVLLALLAAAGLGGCASAARRAQSDLTALEHSLPGGYASSSAAAGAAASGGAMAVRIAIQPVQNQTLGDAVYYVRETAADNARLVLWQGMWTLSVRSHPDAIVQHSYLFKDPRRWLEAAQSPDLLRALLPEDLQELAGCELTWVHDATGFVATQSDGCTPGNAAAGVWIAQRITLTSASLTLVERRTGPQGALVRSGPPITLVLARSGG